MMAYMRARQAVTNGLDEQAQKPKRAPKSKDLKKFQQTKLIAINQTSMGMNSRSEKKGQGVRMSDERLQIGAKVNGNHRAIESKSLETCPQSPEEVVLELAEDLKAQ